MLFRRFSPEQLAICEQWFNEVETSETWEDKGPVGEGESESRRVENRDGLRGVAKPGVVKTDGVWRSAHEKIAFDLAHLLDLPIPPVVLWDRGDDPKLHRYSSISAWAFPNAMKWNLAEGKGLISAASLASAGPVASATRVFHTWISDTDRKPDHIQIDLDSPDGQLGMAFIDHAYSMSQVWKGPNWKAGASKSYKPIPEIPDVMLQMSEKIAALNTDNISGIINRIPSQYLPSNAAEHIISNLVSRKGQLPALLSI